jgi:hypothetical protein
MRTHTYAFVDQYGIERRQYMNLLLVGWVVRTKDLCDVRRV